MSPGSFSRSLHKKGKSVILVIAGFVLALTVFAQTVKETAVPAAVKSAFAKKYPGINKVKWEKEKGNYEANFEQQGKEASAVFSATGNFEESEIGISATELPAAVREYVNTHYKGATIKEAAKITKANGEVLYEANVKNKELIFDAQGGFVKVV